MAEKAAVSTPVTATSQGQPGHSWKDAASEWRANWRIGLAAFIAIGLSNGAFLSISSLYIVPLQNEFGWSRAEVAYAHNAGLVVAMAAPFAGRAIDHFGARIIMLVGMFIMTLIYAGFALMNGSLLTFYTLKVLAGVIGLCASGLTCSRVVSQAFIRSRGLSLAVARSGLAVAAAILPIALFAVIANYGWRAGYAAQSLLVLVIAIPVVYFWIQHGRVPSNKERLRPQHAGPRWYHHLRDRRVWLICFGAALGYAPSNAIMTQLQPLLVGKGVSGGDAAALVGLAGLASLVGAILTGSLVDRFWAPAIALLFACGSAAGTCVLAMNGSLDGPLASLAILLIGLGLGAEIDVVAYLVARYFGVQSFSTLYGLAVFFVAFSGALGTSLLGIAFDAFGNYDLALLFIAAAFMVAGCLYLLLGRYPPEHAEH